MPQAYMEKLKKAPVIVGHERCASSQFAEGQTLIICAVHSYGRAREVLMNGRYYQACGNCVEEECEVVEATTEPRPRGPYVSLGED